MTVVIRANTLGGPKAALAAGIEQSLLGGGRRSNGAPAVDSAIANKLGKGFWVLDDWSFGREEIEDGEHIQKLNSSATPL